MDGEILGDGFFKNIIRQVVHVSRSAFGLTENASKLANNIKEQTGQAGRVLDENRDTQAEIREILAKTAGLAETASQADQVSRLGREKQKAYLQEIDKLSDSIQQGSLFLEKFRESSEDIARLNQLIMELSGRLDVLAINGAIEAARGGEAGRGFSVIAREMKRLAQETSVSAEEVGKIVKKFQGSSREVQSLFKKSSGSIETSRSEAGGIYDMFLEIEEQNDRVSAESVDIRTLLESLSLRNEKSNQSTGKILGAADNSGRQVDKIGRQSTELHAVVGNLLEDMGEIRLDWHEKTLGAVREIADGLRAAQGNFNPALLYCFEKYPYMELLYIMDERGIQVESNLVHPEFIEQIAAGGEGADRRFKDYFKELADGKDFYISGIYVSTAVNHLCITISVPFYRDGRKYILAADMNLESFVMQE